MGIKYDPMTGEPIETPDEIETSEVNKTTTDNINSNAEEVVAQNSSVETPAEEVDSQDKNVEDATSENTVEENAVISSESITDETSGNTAESNQESSSETAETNNIESNSSTTVNKFDPFTGEPIINSESVIGEEPVINIENTKKGMEPKKLLIPLLAIVAIIALIAIFVLGGVFSTKKQKVARAIINTAKVESKLLDELNRVAEVLNSNEFTTTYNVDAGKLGSLEGVVAISDKAKQIYIDSDIESAVPFSVLAEINNKSVKAEIPKFSDYVFVYNYTEDKDGFLVDELSEETISQLDNIISVIYENKKSNNEFVQKVVKLNKEYSKQLEFEKADSKSFKVNGKKVECKGYSLEIENDLMVDYFSDFLDIYLEEIESSLDEIEKLADIDSLEDDLKDIKKELKDIPDIEITFYIYKNALAGIHCDAGKRNGELDIYFRGGDFRAQNVVIEADGEEVFSIKCSKKNDKEVYKIKVDNETVEITYNTKKGDITFTVDNGRKEEEYELSLETKDGITTFIFDEIEIPYVGSFDVELSVQKGAKLNKFTNTETFDIGNADKHDFQDLIDNLGKDVTEEISNLF